MNIFGMFKKINVKRTRQDRIDDLTRSDQSHQQTNEFASKIIQIQRQAKVLDRNIEQIRSHSKELLDLLDTTQKIYLAIGGENK